VSVLRSGLVAPLNGAGAFAALEIATGLACSTDSLPTTTGVPI
jgi:hypothetical protein